MAAPPPCPCFEGRASYQGGGRLARGTGRTARAQGTQGPRDSLSLAPLAPLRSLDSGGYRLRRRPMAPSTARRPAPAPAASSGETGAPAASHAEHPPEVFGDP